ncbi:MAG: T9SS type A sorting domain-containing protein, partial [Candidatus Cloacimonadaceae bacterium]|nr:T9SS type A sorting domain-containing protein [Candidatus Cloacimonadaceae bacterium]
LWHDDDFTNNFLIDNLSLLGGYILGGGKVIISGWKSASVLNSEWLERFTGSVELVYDNSASLISALSDDYPVLLPDPDKLSPSWNGMLPMIYTFDNVQTSLYTANMLPGSLGNGKSLAFKYDNHGSLVMFGLPLYFLQADGVRTMLQQLIRELLPGVEAADHILPVPNLSLTAYPNPFGSQVSFEVKGISGKAGSLDIYNVKGQRVKRIALSPGNRDYTWNGLDESGNKTAPGIYFIKASDTRAQITRKIIKL